MNTHVCHKGLLLSGAISTYTNQAYIYRVFSQQGLCGPASISTIPGDLSAILLATLVPLLLVLPSLPLFCDWIIHTDQKDGLQAVSVWPGKVPLHGAQKGPWETGGPPFMAPWWSREFLIESTVPPVREARWPCHYRFSGQLCCNKAILCLYMHAFKRHMPQYICFLHYIVLCMSV